MFSDFSQWGGFCVIYTQRAPWKRWILAGFLVAKLETVGYNVW